jgi:hypothetical protein
MGKTLLRADHEWVIRYIHSSFLITDREIIKIFKIRAEGNYKNYIALILLSQEPLKTEH